MRVGSVWEVLVYEGCVGGVVFFFFFKQKTAYEIYQCDWSSDVCSSDLAHRAPVTDMSESRACIRISGAKARATLQKGCPLDRKSVV